jgi:hypothetical protein
MHRGDEHGLQQGVPPYLGSLPEEPRLKREDMPCLIVFSDMQFDQASSGYGNNATVFQTTRQKVQKTAKGLGWDDSEQLSCTGTFATHKDTECTVMLSDFLPSLLKLTMSGEALKEEVVEVVGKDGNCRQGEAAA